MKKIISLALVIAMVMSFGITAFAEDANPLAPQSGDVTATYAPATSVGGTVYSINVSWTSFAFTYNQASAPTWNPETHQYSDTQNVEEGWGDSEATITVANNSNVHIQAVPSYAAEAGYEAISMNFDIDTLLVCSADINNREETATIVVTPSGTLSGNETTEAGVKIGSITVSISEYNVSREFRTMYNDVADYNTEGNEEGFPEETMTILKNALFIFNEYQSDPEEIEVNELVYWWIRATNARNSCTKYSDIV